MAVCPEHEEFDSRLQEIHYEIPNELQRESDISNLSFSENH
jgi:hypothetical protein